jgi:hypothetical protein
MTPYTLSYSFSGYQAIQPSRPLPGPEVDNEFANLAASVTSIIAAVNQVRRSDGAVQNGVVTFDSLDPQLAAIIGGTNDITVPDINPTAFASQSEAEGGVSNDKIMTPLRSAQALDALRPFASQGQAQSGTDTSATVMTPVRVRESITARRPFASQAQAQNGVNDTTVMSPLRTAQALDALRTAHTAVANLTFGAIAAGASATQVISVPNAAVGDGVVVGLPAAGIQAGLVPVAWVSAAGSVTLRITNTTAGSLTPAVADFRVTAIRF